MNKQPTIATLRQRCLVFALALVCLSLFFSLHGFAQTSEKEADATPATTAVQPVTEVKNAPQEATETKAQPEAPATEGASQDAPVIKNRKDRVSYALGVEVARGLKGYKRSLDLDLFVTALRDAMAGNKLVMSEKDAVAAVKNFQEERKRDLEHAKHAIAEKNRKAGEAFVAENVKKEGVVTLPSGLQYTVLKQGDGKKPTVEDKVECHYRGTLIDGTEFDNSYKRDEPATFSVKEIIKGWSEALQLMPVGSKWRLFIPSQLAFGDRVVGGIGPSAMLIVDVELLSIKEKS
jgi:FKBP-type peptidyl-prolyl cis-trans isomerase FklB